MKLIKKILKNNIFCFILGAFIFGVIGVSAATYFASSDVTYDNSASGLSSTDVQGAIDELYGVCTTPMTAGDTILEQVEIVTSGDGLYSDKYEDGRYFYRGGNPNNYITFNNEFAGWRIVSIELDGTIKIIKNESIGNIVWATSNSNNWSRPATINTYLNETYYNNELNSTAQSQIVTKGFSIGGVTNNNDLANQINNENSTKWHGKVALVTVSEYIRSNSNQSICGSLSLSNNNYGTCKNTTWMYINETCWTLSSRSGSSNRAFYVQSDNNIIGNDGYSFVNIAYGTRPVLYLSSEVKIIGGDGSQNNPYEISL